MAAKQLSGRMTQGDDPNWRPLTRVVGDDLAGAFMWMFEVRLEDGRSVHAYKHIESRRYLHLDAGGNAFVYIDDGRYQPIPLAVALELALRTWWERLRATPEQVLGAWTAIERARLRDPRD